MLDVEKLIVDNNKMKSDATIAVAVFIMSASVIYTFGVLILKFLTILEFNLFNFLPSPSPQVIQMLWATKRGGRRNGCAGADNRTAP